MKKRTLNQQSGYIENDSGKIVIDNPAVHFSQDTLMGKIEYILNGGGGVNQYVPHINYWDIYFTGSSRKFLEDTTKYLVSMSRFRSDSIVQMRIHDKTQVDIEGYITHNGHVNWGVSYGLIKLKEDIVRRDADSIDGTGLFKELELDNPEGAEVINGGGFRVGTLLELKRGTLRNNDTNNFVMSDSLGTPKIKRHPGGHIQHEPGYENRYHVHYVGNESMLTEAEIPKNEDVLEDLIVENTGGLHFDRDVTANRNIIVGSYINTEFDYTDNSHTLTSTSDLDPQYLTSNSEVWGSFRRTKLDYYDSVLFNNDYTYVHFGGEENASGISEMTIRVRPKLLPPNADPETKAERDIYISARDAVGDPVKSGMNFTLGYGWRHIPSEPARHETNNLVIQDIILQRWDNDFWHDINSSRPPETNSSGWGHSYATNINRLGQFALGISNIGQLVVNAKILMEGPYRYGSMANDLMQRNLVPNIPPDIYPYNMDPNRDSNIASIIDSHVVDWVLVEFQKIDTSGLNETFYRCGLLLTDGRIVEADGQSALSIARGGMEEGDYYIAVRHRNHHAVYAKESIAIFPQSNAPEVDLTKASNLLFGGTEAKPVGFDANLSLLFGMRSGETDARATGENMIKGRGEIYGERDDISIWEQRDTESYNLFDATLSGIVTTRDLNYSWNNRGLIENKR